MKKRKLLLIVVLLLLAIWMFSLLKCEVLTMLHREEFLDSQIEMVGEWEYFRVLSYNQERAEVYYVHKEKAYADVVTFVNENDVWKAIGFNTIWSDYGSASEVIYPYLWHFIYGGF